MKKIPLTQGKFALVNDADYEWLSQYKWYAWYHHKNWYAIRTPDRVFMHRLILNLENGDGKITDHINHNGLNNRRSNIRIVTNRENQLNRKKSPKGICWSVSRQKWQAYICINREQKSLGRFKKKRDALQARKEAEQKYFGEFAYA